MCGLDSDSDGFPDVELDCDDASCQRVSECYTHRETHMLPHTCNMHTYTSIIYVCVHCADTYTHMHTYICKHVHMQISIYILYVCIDMRTHVTCIVYMHSHVYIHTHIHSYTHTCHVNRYTRL